MPNVLAQGQDKSAAFGLSLWSAMLGGTLVYIGYWFHLRAFNERAVEI